MSATPKHPVPFDARGAHSRHRFVGPFNFVGSHVRKMRLAGHCSRSSVVTARRRKANSPTSVCLAVSGYAVLQLPDRGCYPHSGEHNEREVASQYGLFYHSDSLGPASLSIRLNRLPAVASAERNTESQKFGHTMAFLLIVYSYGGTRPKSVTMAFMRPK